MIVKTKSNHRVRFPERHMELHSTDEEIILKSIGMLDLTGVSAFSVLQVKHDRNVGFTQCVKTAPFDDIVYAQRVGRTTKTRFVMKREPVPCDTVTLLVAPRSSAQCDFILVTGYVGYPAEREVDDPSLKTPDDIRRAIDFWKKHALCWGTQEVVPGTMTRVPPSALLE